MRLFPILVTTAVPLLTGTHAASQKAPVPGDASRIVQVFDVRGLVRGKAAQAAHRDPAKAPVPLLQRLPLTKMLFQPGQGGRPGRGPKGLRAEKMALDSLIALTRKLVRPPFDEGDELKSLGADKLLVFAAPEKVAAVREFLALHRTPTRLSIDVQAKFLRMPAAVYDKFIAPRLRAPQDTKVAGAHCAILPDEAARTRLLRTLAAPKVEELSAPRLLAFALSQAELLVGSRVSYIKDFEIELHKGNLIVDPVIGTVIDGQLFRCAVARASEKTVVLDFELIVSKLARPIPTFTTKLGAGKTKLTVQLPEVKAISIHSWVELAKSQTACFAARGHDGRYLVMLLQAAPTRPANDPARRGPARKDPGK